MLLTPTQARVLGSLIEKDLTTPQQYPLTLNALVTACNQTTSRDPVTDLGDAQVVDAIEALREKGLVRIIHPSSGARSVKYRHVAHEVLELGREELSLIGVLLLRGPQTVNELRTRTERAVAMASNDEVEERLRGLADRGQPLVRLLERQPGQKEPRWTDLLGSRAEQADELAATVPGATPVVSAGAHSPPTPRRAGRTRVSTPRLPALDDGELDDAQRELVGGVTDTVGGASNIFLTLARHPGLLRRWLPFGGKVLAGKLPARDRELLILRTAWRCRAAYEWGHHVAIGLEAGLTQEEIDRIPAGPGGAGWSPGDLLLLKVADQLHDGGGIDDAEWEALAARYDERQLIEIPMVVGQYHLVSFTLNALGIQPEEGIAPLPAGE